MDNWTAIVMAAGKGERMRSTKPKVLHALAGAPMALHVLRAVRHVSPSLIIVVVSPTDHQAIAEVLGGDVEYVEQLEALGTGHALATAIKAVPKEHTHVLLVNGDAPMLRGETVQALVTKHLKSTATVSVLGANLPSARAFDLGRLRYGTDGKLLAIVEAKDDKHHRKNLRAEDLVETNLGLYAFDVRWLRAGVENLAPRESGEYQAVDLVAQAAADGKRVETLRMKMPDEPVGVNTQTQLAEAEAAMQVRLRHQWLERGVKMTDPATVYLGVDVEFASDVTIEPNTIVRGTTRVGIGTKLGPNAVIEDCEIAAGGTIGGSTVRGAFVGLGASVGAYCTLREGTRLERGAYVGNHVEIKQSTIGEDSHVGHFAYVGDAKVGANVNIGAGAVTCNFDGQVKQVTIIEDEAFIGSATMLVAPVRIGKAASTGAGSVISHDVPDGEVVVGVPAHPIKQSRVLREGD